MNADKLFDNAHEKFLSASEAPIRRLWANCTLTSLTLNLLALVGSGLSLSRLQKLAEMMEQGTGVAGFELDQNMRWIIVLRAVAKDLPNADAMLVKEGERD